MYLIAVQNYACITGGTESEIISTIGNKAASKTAATIGKVYGGKPGEAVGDVVGSLFGEVIKEHAEDIKKVVNDVVFSQPVQSAMAGMDLIGRFVFHL